MAAIPSLVRVISLLALVMSLSAQQQGNLCGGYGECGLNGICQVQGDSSICVCPPGFDFFDKNNHSIGCSQKASQVNRCEASTATMLEVEGRIDWSGNDFEAMSPINQTECKNACLEDCFCTVVIYAVLNGTGFCWKKALPLKDGRASNTRTAFVKVYDEATPPTQPGESCKGKSFVAIGISLVGFSAAVAAFHLIIWFCVCRPKLRLRALQERQMFNSERLKAFSYKEIEAATGGFKQVLGRGAFGKVYKGVLSDGRENGVKKLDKLLDLGHEADIGEREFRTEVNIIGATHHKNLVQLYGFCDEGSQRILVYAYMPNGSLDRVLFESKSYIDWELRVQIAIETARGILYLHEECTAHILHCDIKPQNILLDENYSAKISDFGISKLVGSEQTRTFTAARGTIGYIAPEWQRSMAITVKVDVYSFGVMLLEIICCRKMAKADAPENQNILSDWAYDCLKNGRLGELVKQQQSTGGISSKQLERMVMVGLWCIQEDPSVRPSIKTVVQMLEGTIEIAVPPPPGPSSYVESVTSY